MLLIQLDELLSFIVPFTECSQSVMLLILTLILHWKVKKLVYVYLSRYAEEQQDLALLSISTFQRALKVSTEITALSFLSLWCAGLFYDQFLNKSLLNNLLLLHFIHWLVTFIVERLTNHYLHIEQWCII